MCPQLGVSVIRLGVLGSFRFIFQLKTHNLVIFEVPDVKYRGSGRFLGSEHAHLQWGSQLFCDPRLHTDRQFFKSVLIHGVGRP